MAEKFITIPRSPNYKHLDSFTHLPCVVCGREVKNPRHTLHVVDGGGVAVHPDYEPYDDGGADLGFYPIGEDCLRQHPELKPYVHNS